MRNDGGVPNVLLEQVTIEKLFGSDRSIERQQSSRSGHEDWRCVGRRGSQG